VSSHRDELLQKVEELKSQIATITAELDRTTKKLDVSRKTSLWRSSFMDDDASPGRRRLVYFTLAAAPLLLVCFWTWGHHITPLNGKGLRPAPDPKLATAVKVASVMEKPKGFFWRIFGAKGVPVPEAPPAPDSSEELSPFDVLVQALDPEFFEHFAAASTWVVETASEYSSKTLSALTPDRLSEALQYESLFGSDSKSFQSMGGVAVGLCFGYILAGQLRWR